jgi:hypothetical protein
MPRPPPRPQACRIVIWIPHGDAPGPRCRRAGELLVFCDETMLRPNIVLPGERSATQPIPLDDAPEPVAYYYPISAVAAEIVGKADSWRRRHRVSVRDWPPSM